MSEWIAVLAVAVSILLLLLCGWILGFWGYWGDE